MARRAHDRNWANPVEFEYYAMGLSDKVLCRLFGRCGRTVRDWRSGRRPIPSWTVEVLKLEVLEYREMLHRLRLDVPPLPTVDDALASMVLRRVGHA